MATPYEKVYKSFMDLVLKDRKFFIDHPEKMLEERLLNLLDKGLTSMYLVPTRKNFELNFMAIRDDDLLVFTEDLSVIEISLIAYFMFQEYIEQDVIERMRALKSIGFKSDEIISFSPANTIKEFYAGLDSLKAENCSKLKQYKSISRDTYEYKSFDFKFD